MKCNPLPIVEALTPQLKPYLGIRSRLSINEQMRQVQP